MGLDDAHGGRFSFATPQAARNCAGVAYFLSDNPLWPITLQASALSVTTVSDCRKPYGFPLLRTDCRPTITPCSGCTALAEEAAHEAHPCGQE